MENNGSALMNIGIASTLFALRIQYDSYYMTHTVWVCSNPMLGDRQL